MTQRLSEVLKSADQLNPSSTMAHDWFLGVQKSVGRARVHRKILHVSSVATLIVIVLFGGTSLYAQGVAPDHPLYPVKHWSEYFVILVTPQNQKAFVYRHLIDRRVEEAKKNPDLADLLLPDLNQLMLEQEQVIAQENQADALSQTITQATMFEQDIGRLRAKREAEEIALALTLHNQKLLERFRNSPDDLQSVGEVPDLPPLNLVLMISGGIGTRTPESITKSFSNLESLRKEISQRESLDPVRLLEFLTSRNNLHLELLNYVQN